MININIVTQLLCFITLAVMANNIILAWLLIVFAVLQAAIIVLRTLHFSSLVIRFKWLFLVMLLILSFSTPGEHLQHWPLAISPTYEGLQLAMTQVMRIIVILAVLSLILALNTRSQLISGFYVLASPLQYIGLKVDRFAARLWLTLHYVEMQAINKKSLDREFNDAHEKDTHNIEKQYNDIIYNELLSRLKNMVAIQTQSVENEIQTIMLEKPIFGFLDGVVLLGLGIFIYFKVFV